MTSKIKSAALLLMIVCNMNCLSYSQTNKQLSKLEAAFPTHRYAKNPIIKHGGGWKDSQVQEPCIVKDPDNSSQLIMFFAAMSAPTASGVMSIGVATASKANPYEWHEDASNPIMLPGEPGQWDERWIRLDSVVPLGGKKFRVFYTGHGNNNFDKDQVGTAVFTKQGSKWIVERDKSNPILTPSNDENYVSQAAVIKDGGNWYMHYSYRTAAQTLPGLRLAVSKDGIHFIKPGKQILSIGPTGAFDSYFIEWHQLQKIGKDYVELYETYNGRNWSIGMASAKRPDIELTKSANNPVFKASGISGTFDEVNVATPAAYCINEQWMLFYQGANLPYSSLFSYGYSNWDIGIADVTPVVKTKKAKK